MITFFQQLCLFQILAKNKAEESCHELIDCLLTNYEPQEKTNPSSTISGDADVSDNSSIEIYRLASIKRSLLFCEIVETFVSFEHFDENEKFDLQSSYETFDATDREFFVEDGTTGSVEYRKYSDVGQYSKQVRS